MDSKFKKAPIHIEFLAIKYTLKKKKNFRKQKSLRFSWHQADPYLNSLLLEIASVDYTWDIKLCAQRYHIAICLLHLYSCLK